MAKVMNMYKSTLQGGLTLSFIGGLTFLMSLHATMANPACDRLVYQLFEFKEINRKISTHSRIKSRMYVLGVVLCMKKLHFLAGTGVRIISSVGS